MSKVAWALAIAAVIGLGGCKKDNFTPHHRLLGESLEGDDGPETEKKTFTPEEHFDLGMLYYGGGKLDEAEKQFLMALKDRPDYPEGHTGMGYVYHFKAFIQIQAHHAPDAIKLHQQAAKHFLTALAKNPKKVEALVGLAMVYFDEYYWFVPHKDEYRTKAVGYLEQARKVAPNDLVVQANVSVQEAKMLVTEKGYKQAIRPLTDVVRCKGIDPVSKVEAHYLLAGCLYTQGDKDGAIEQYRAYLDACPKAPDREEVNDLIVKIQETMK